MLEPVNASLPGSLTRWDATIGALRSFLESEQVANARIGLQFFGLTNGNDDCSVDKYRLPVVEIAPLVSNRGALLTALDTTLPGSLTPMAPAVTGVRSSTRCKWHNSRRTPTSRAS